MSAAGAARWLRLRAEDANKKSLRFKDKEKRAIDQRLVGRGIRGRCEDGDERRTTQTRDYGRDSN